MDVIALDRAGIGEAVARSARRSPKASSSGCGGSSRAHPVLRRRQCRPEGRDQSGDERLPLLRPDRTLRFVELPSGQDPDDVVRAGGREAFEELLANAEPLDARLWRHELGAEP